MRSLAKWLRRATLLAVLAGASPGSALGGVPPADGTPAEPATGPTAPGCTASDAELEADGAVIRRVAIRVGDIFDASRPDEDNWLFRLANRLHRKTRPGVVEDQILFRPGDAYSSRLMRESERLLRARLYFYDATIRPIWCEGGQVDVEVAARDVWTLNPGFRFGRSGGKNRTGVKLQDNNLLGTGKAVTVERNSTVDRSTSVLRYEDPNVLGSRWELAAWYGDNSDGSLRTLAVRRPFFSFDTRWAGGLRVEDEDRVDPLYALGEIVDRFRHRRTRVEASGGFSRGFRDGWSRRWIGGVTFSQDRFEAAPDLPPPSHLPAERTLIFPWLGFEWVEDSYREIHDLDQLDRTEDLYLGGQVQFRLGWSSATLGADLDAGVFGASARKGLRLGSRQVLLGSLGTGGRWRHGRAENFELGGGVRYYWRDFGRHLLFARLEATLANRLDGERQLLLGGDNGLRGYPLRYQDGDRRFLLTLEQRFFTGLYPFRLVHVGAAVFVDLGRTWPGPDSLAPNLGLLKDVGFGLRLGSSRSGRGSLVHVDVAFPLDGEASIRGTQFLVTTKDTF